MLQVSCIFVHILLITDYIRRFINNLDVNRLVNRDGGSIAGFLLSILYISLELPDKGYC